MTRLLLSPLGVAHVVDDDGALCGRFAPEPHERREAPPSAPACPNCARMARPRVDEIDHASRAQRRRDAAKRQPRPVKAAQVPTPVEPRQTRAQRCAETHARILSAVALDYDATAVELARALGYDEKQVRWTLSQAGFRRQLQRDGSRRWEQDLSRARPDLQTSGVLS